jgi:beta-phosphoglucomutase-like phosphatase (HAD superfamily)
MAVQPEHCVVIEDSAAGVSAGRTAGMAVIGFTGAAHATSETAMHLAAAGANPVISSMVELPGAVRKVMSWVEKRQST